MKHENNFFLYAIGSACLVIFGMVLVSSASFERKENLVANTIAVSAIVEHKPLSTNNYFSGTVFQDTNTDGFFEKGKDTIFSGRNVFLWKQNEEMEWVRIETAETDEFGKYSFKVSKEGVYSITIDQFENEKITNPPPSLDGFSNSTHVFTVFAPRGDNYYAGINFGIVK